MLSIDDDRNIYINKGDTGTFNITLTNSTGQEYTPQDEDVLEFLVRNGSNTILDKSISTADMTISLNSVDTNNLNTGTYQYSIEQSNNDEPVTLTSGNFTVNSANIPNVGSGGISQDIDMLGYISGSTGQVNGSIDSGDSLTGYLDMGSGADVDVYTGPTTFIPDTDNDIVAQTQMKFLHYNITIKKIPYYETSNLTGTTVYIGG